MKNGVYPASYSNLSAPKPKPIIVTLAPPATQAPLIQAANLTVKNAI